MPVVRDYLYVAPEDRGACVAIGNFDGVHLGHQSVIDQTRRIAGELNCPFGIMTFEPHPRSYFNPGGKPFRLMNAQAKAHQLEKLGVTHLYELNFNAALSSLSAEEFARDVISDGLGLMHVVIGADFCFGKARQGDAKMMERFGAEMGFGVTIVPLIADQKGIFSSTSIREALTAGKPEDAARMLGHWHRIEGRVIRGDQRGRDLGFPTANMVIDGLHQPKFGVYAVLVDVLDGAHLGRYQGAASIGERPTFGVYSPNLEVFLFDFQGDLYGAQLSVALVAFQRPELKFENIDALIKQMQSDCEESAAILEALS